MNSKNIFLLIFTFCVSIATYAQSDTEKLDDSRKVIYRAELGYGQDFRHGKFTVTSPYHSIRGGLNLEFPLVYGLGIETGLKYTNSFGSRNELFAHNDTASYKYNGHFLDIPARATYTLPIFWGLKLFAFAGPTLSVGVLHTDVVDFTNKAPNLDPAPTHPVKYPQAGTYNSYANDLRRFNIQLGTGGGLQWRNYRVKSGYNWGINSLSKDKNYPQRMQGWHVAFEYEF